MPTATASPTGLFLPPAYFRRWAKPEIFVAPDRALEVDVGCGDGGFIAAMAAQHPERDFLGLDRLFGRVRKVVRAAREGQLTNLKVARLDIAYAVPQLLPRGGVRRLHLLFPDPWPKARHAKHRLVQPAFCAGVAAALEPDGEWLFRTDHAEYFDDAVSVIRKSGWFEEQPWTEGEFFYPLTDFERLWLGEGRTIQRARFRKRAG
jgi:tRNA (guanine-N7-)-methyltransferase